LLSFSKVEDKYVIRATRALACRTFGGESAELLRLCKESVCPATTRTTAYRFNVREI